ncbi:flagellar filament capping protein FliD [Inhella sp.]|uniref:flagellar filament capping protein FliD n=1 Tax=Inhella sp. TaxID=1921806 RepID=UPI0035B4BCAA
MATITSAGIGSGLDVETLISRLVAVERTPIQQIQQRATGFKTQLSAYGKLQSNLSTLRDAAARLTRADTFGAVTATSSNATTASATAATGTTAGSYTVRVDKLAAAQSIATNAVPSGSALGTGTITIDFGSYTDDGMGGFTFDADPTRTSVIIPVATGEDALEQIRDKINAMKRGIVASVVSDANGSRLVMRGVDPGAANAFRVSVADDDGNNTDTSGLSALAYDLATGVNTSSRKQAAQNAEANIDGIDIVSATNTVTGAVSGLTITLGKVSADPVTLTVAQDKSAIKKSITDFANAYNETVKFLREQSRYDPGSKTGGPLLGDSTATSVLNQLRGLGGGNTSLGGTLTRFAEIGLDPQSDGTFKVNDTKLDAALDKGSDLKAFFSAVDELEAGNSGLAVRLRKLTDDLLSVDGRVTNRQKGIQTRIDETSKQEAQVERRVELVEKRLRAQYTALDATMGKMQGLSSYLNQQLQKL